MTDRERIAEKAIAIRAIECYLTWTPRDRRKEIATQILKALEMIGYTRPSTPLRTSQPDDEPDWAGARHQTLKNEPEPVDGAAETRQNLAEGYGITFPNAEEAVKWLSALEKDSLDEISDGFGTFWPVTCPECGGKSMAFVRPGKVQCSNCGFKIHREEPKGTAIPD